MKRAPTRSRRSTVDLYRGKPLEFSMSFTESQFKSCYDFKKRFKIKSTIGYGGQAHVKEAIDQ